MEFKKLAKSPSQNLVESLITWKLSSLANPACGRRPIGQLPSSREARGLASPQAESGVRSFGEEQGALCG